jgi:hypothetical protein
VRKGKALAACMTHVNTTAGTIECNIALHCRVPPKLWSRAARGYSRSAQQSMMQDAVWRGCPRCMRIYLTAWKKKAVCFVNSPISEAKFPATNVLMGYSPSSWTHGVGL